MASTTLNLVQNRLSIPAGAYLSDLSWSFETYSVHNSGYGMGHSIDGTDKERKRGVDSMVLQMSKELSRRVLSKEISCGDETARPWQPPVERCFPFTRTS